MKKTLGLILFLIFSCQTSEENHLNTRLNQDNTPKIAHFSYTACVQNCREPEKILMKEYKEDRLKLKIGSIQNCSGEFDLEIKTNKDTLDLLINLKKKIVKRENGEIDTLINYTFCDCYFYFNFEIKNVSKEFQTILVAGKEIGKSAIMLDEEVVEEDKPVALLQTGEPDPYGFMNVNQEPIIVNLNEVKKKILTDKRFIEKNIKGKVIIRALIDTSGKFVKNIVLKQTDSILTAIVEEHIKDIRCEPALYNNKPIMCWISLPFKFE